MDVVLAITKLIINTRIGCTAVFRAEWGDDGQSKLKRFGSTSTVASGFEAMVEAATEATSKRRL